MSGSLSPLVEAPVLFREPKTPLRIHVIGLGKVGRALLRQLAPGDHVLAGASDRSGTILSARHLDPHALCAHKESGDAIAALANAGRVPLPVLLYLAAPDVVVDCTDSNLAASGEAVARARAVLTSGAKLVLASKTALLADTATLIAAALEHRAGLNAVLGGTGRVLVRDLARLRDECVEITAVGNVTSTEIICAIEAGASIREALAQARDAGLLEADPRQDLNGLDSGIKLGILANAIFGNTRTAKDVAQISVKVPAPRTLRREFAEGRTTRLVARATRDAGSLCYEPVARASALAAPRGHVVYEYRLRSGERIVHVGTGVGPTGTAGAILADLTDLLIEKREERRS